MTVIARDAVASDHLVYAWPFPLGPECEVTCAEDEQVVMCPAYLVGDRLGPGRHRYRTPDPTRPVAAFFVLTSAVEVSFDMMTSFLIPTTGMPVRLRATGSIHVRCADPTLLIAQFVGLPFDHVNDGILRSVSRSVERMLARLLTRRVVMAGSPVAVTDPSMLANIVEELIAYNPTAGAVFGVELMRVGHLSIGADDGTAPVVMMPAHPSWSSGARAPVAPAAPPQVAAPPPLPPTNGERAHHPTEVPPLAAVSTGRGSAPKLGARPTAVSGEIGGRKPAAPRAAGTIEVPRSPEDVTQPNLSTPLPGTLTTDAVAQATPPPTAVPTPITDEVPRGSIMGIGVSPVGSGSVSGQLQLKVPPGGRVLVPGPNGLMQSATVRQLLQGYYELEVGSTGQTIWVPINGVVPE